MSNPTNPFSWQMPTPTDLVTDLPADFEVFGQAVATSLADLLGGTTGQVLSKTTNTDMDFTWVSANPGDITEVTVSSPITGGGSSGSVNVAIQDGTTAQKGAVQLENSTSSTSTTTASVPAAVKTSYDLAAAAIPKSTGTTAGDVIYYTGSATPVRLGIGTANQILAVNAGATAPEWKTPAGGGGKVLQVVEGILTGNASTTSTSYVDSGLTVTITPSSATSKVLVFATCSNVGKTAANTYGSFQLVRGSTKISYQDYVANTGTAVALQVGTLALVKLDSPATTSATTYKIQFKNESGIGTILINEYASNPNDKTSSIIAMEIGA
jgi:hypothetical protein